MSADPKTGPSWGAGSLQVGDDARGQDGLTNARDQRSHVAEMMGRQTSEGGVLQINPGQKRAGMAQPVRVRVVEREQLQIPGPRRPTRLSLH